MAGNPVNHQTFRIGDRRYLGEFPVGTNNGACADLAGTGGVAEQGQGHFDCLIWVSGPLEENDIGIELGQGGCGYVFHASAINGDDAPRLEAGVRWQFVLVHSRSGDGGKGIQSGDAVQCPEEENDQPDFRTEEDPGEDCGHAQD